MKDFLAAEDMALLHRCDVGPEDVQKALAQVLSVEAFDFTRDTARPVRGAMVGVVFEGLKVVPPRAIEGAAESKAAAELKDAVGRNDARAAVEACGVSPTSLWTTRPGPRWANGHHARPCRRLSTRGAGRTRASRRRGAGRWGTSS